MCIFVLYIIDLLCVFLLLAGLYELRFNKYKMVNKELEGNLWFCTFLTNSECPETLLILYL